MTTTPETAAAILTAIRADVAIGAGTCTGIDECWSDAELLEAIAEHQFTSVEQGIDYFRSLEGIRIEQATNTRWGADDDSELQAYNDHMERCTAVDDSAAVAVAVDDSEAPATRHANVRTNRHLNRYRTTQRVTLRIAGLIAKYIALTGSGVMVRHRGQARSVDGIRYGRLFSERDDNGVLVCTNLLRCFIHKTTVTQLEALVLAEQSPRYYAIRWSTTNPVNGCVIWRSTVWLFGIPRDSRFVAQSLREDNPARQTYIVEYPTD